MFNVPQSKVNEFAKLFETHRLQISACDVFFQNVRMLNGRHTILTKNDYAEFYRNFTRDIELETSPIDAFVPCEPNEVNPDLDVEEKPSKLFVVNQLTPEYERIRKRIPLEELKRTLPPTHPVIMALDKNEVSLSDVIDDIFIYYCLYKYLDQIEQIRMYIFSNMTPAIEYVVDNITKADLIRFMSSRRIDHEKIAKHQDLVFFKPDYRMICKFYQDNSDPLFAFDLDDLLNRLTTNIVLKSDIYIILAIYLIASFAVSDITHKIDSPCTKYVREVLSPIN